MLCLKTNSFPFWCGRIAELVEGIVEGFYLECHLGIGFLLLAAHVALLVEYLGDAGIHLVHAVRQLLHTQVFVLHRSNSMAYRHKCPHNINVHLYGRFRPQHRTEHGYTKFGEDVRLILCMLPSTRTLIHLV